MGRHVSFIDELKRRKVVRVAALYGASAFAILEGADLLVGSFGLPDGLLRILAIVAGVVFGFELGTFFSIAMIGLAGGSILYDTSNVLHHFPEDRYVGAALELFASVALMFWYVLRIFMSRD